MLDSRLVHSFREEEKQTLSVFQLSRSRSVFPFVSMLCAIQFFLQNTFPKGIVSSFLICVLRLENRSDSSRSNFT